MTFEIGVGSADDVQRMARWAADEGWNPGNTDAHAFFVADPGAFLIGRLDGEPVTCISVVRYGQASGFLGFYIARPAVRGKGRGLPTWDAGMARLAGRNVGLDGVVAQQANYRKSGFRNAWNNIRYEGAAADAAPPAGRHPRRCALDPVRPPGRLRPALLPRSARRVPGGVDLAARARGAGGRARRRHRGLRRDAGLPGGVARRPAVRRPSGDRRGAGRRPGDGDMGAGAVAIDMPDINKQAVTLAEQAGLKPSFETARMYTGHDPVIDYAGLFGVTSLELG